MTELHRGPEIGGKVTHLGQIMTYLAGLDASTVVWLATDFREPHLAAIRWLNEHTVEPFAFFAIRLRVVRIAESPLAPVFEILERPNAWERQVQSISRATAGETELGLERRAFWEGYLEAYPEDRSIGFKPNGTPSVWLPFENIGLLISVFRARGRVGIFVRGRWGATTAEVEEILAPLSDELKSKLGVPLGPKDGKQMFFHAEFEVDLKDEENLPRAYDWLHGRAAHYYQVIRDALDPETTP